MPTAQQRDDVREDLGESSSSLTDAKIDRLYARAEADYPDNDRAVEAQVRILALRQLKSEASKRVDYTQGESEEKLSQVYKQIDGLLKDFMADLTSAIATTLPPVQFGGLRCKPTRLEDYPES